MSPLKSTIRSFFAIALPPSLKNEVSEFIQQLKTQFPAHAIRWVKSEHLHITLQFLPAINTEDVARLLSEAKLAMVESIDSLLTLGSLAFLPNERRPHVLILDVSPAAPLIILANALGKAICNVGYAVETRPFRGHLTLGRVENSKALRHFALEQIEVPDFSTMEMTEIIYYQSEQTQQGSRYIELGKIVL